MNLAPLLFGILASASFALLFFYASFLGYPESFSGTRSVLALGAVAALIGTVLGAVPVVRLKKAGQRQKRLPVIGLVISSAVLTLIVGYVLITVWFAIGLDKHSYAQTPGPVDGSTGFSISPYEIGFNLSFRTLDWSCQPNEADGQNLDDSGSGYVCWLDFEVSASRYGNNIDESASIPPEQWPTVDSFDQRVVDRCYRRSQGGPFRRSEGCSSPQHTYSGYADREREYEAWDLGYRAKSGTCFDQPVGPDTSIVCQSLFRVPELPDFVSYQWEDTWGGSLVFLPGVKMTPPTTTPTLPQGKL